MMEVLINPRGQAMCMYTEDINLAALGKLSIRRVSRVEPDAQARWWGDMAPMGGPKLGPFERRSGALEAERKWMAQHLGEGVRDSR